MPLYQFQTPENPTTSIIVVVECEPEIVILFDAQHADITDRERDPSVFLGELLDNADATHGTHSIVADIG